MSLLSSFAIIVALCVLAVLILPQPKYGALRGCTGRALQAVLEKEQRAARASKTSYGNNTSVKPGGKATDGD